MLSFIIGVIKLLIILCIVALVHEFGHFLAAKLLKIGVNEFSIGFGPKIFQKKYKDTVYSLRWIPLGGYVMIEGEGEKSEKQNSFDKQHPFKRIIVLVMGVIFNLILGFVILIVASLFTSVYTTEITELSQNSPLLMCDIRVGDKITKVNGKKVIFASELLQANDANEDDVTIEYLRDNEKHIALIKDASKQVGYAGIVFNTNESNCVINSFQSSSPATQTSLKKGDVITEINGVSIENYYDAITIIQSLPNQEVIFKVIREDEILDINVKLGISRRLNLGILSTKEEKCNLYYSVEKTVKTIINVAGSYLMIFTGKVGINDVSSIVGIGSIVSKTSSLIEYLSMLAVISLAVGAANILPFVPLDGGKIVFVLYEWIARRKVNEKVEITVTYIGWGLLMLLTIVVTFKDIINIF